MENDSQQQPELLSEMTEFKSGAKRSSAKPRYDLIMLCFLRRIARVWEAGAKKYGSWNWQKGMTDPEFIQDIPNHIIEHIHKYVAGDKTEDHLANICCNVQMLMHADELAQSKS